MEIVKIRDLVWWAAFQLNMLKPFNVGNHLVQFDWFLLTSGFFPRPLLFSKVGYNDMIPGSKPRSFHHGSFVYLFIRLAWTWFQSGINTDGAHNPVTTRRLEKGDILSLNCFPMIAG